MGNSEESTVRETEDEEEIEGELGEYEKEEGEEEETDVTVSLVDVLGMVKYKGERTTALQERIHKLSQKLQEIQHQKHIQLLQQLQQQMQLQKQKGERESGTKKGITEGIGGWMLVFVVLAGGLGIILFLLRKSAYFSSLHPS
jgi:TolA-binding protein